MDNDDINLEEQFKNLPPELQKAISSVDLSDKLQQITRNEKLLIDQADAVQKETLLVLLGINPIDDYINNIGKNAGLDKNTALKVAHDADELIFKNVRENLKVISQQISLEENAEISEKNNIPKQSDVLAGIENPSGIKNEGSVSVSSMPSNNPEEKSPEYVPFNKGIEIRKEITPEIEPEMLPAVEPGEGPKNNPVKPEMYSENIPPVANIVESKMTGEVAVPKKEIVIEEKSKLPEVKTAPSSGEDPYREPIE